MLLMMLMAQAERNYQNLRDEVAMDVDEDEDGTQQPKRVDDFGIEVDFESLDDDEREVIWCFLHIHRATNIFFANRMVPRKH